MADDLAARVRAALGNRAFAEKRMFGGIAFMIGGKMIASASKRGLLVRVGKDGVAAAVKDPKAKRVEMGAGRPMSGYVRVAEAGLTDADLVGWLQAGMAVVAALGASSPAPKAKPAAGKAKPGAKGSARS